MIKRGFVDDGLIFFLNFAIREKNIVLSCILSEMVKRIILILLAALALPSVTYGRQDSLRSSWREAESYTRLAPYAVVGGLKLAGVKGRSSWGRLTATTAMANVVMAGSTYALKHTVSEARPDRSDHHSFPSGHTATAFAAATVLHREYGLTLSPWISAGGYAVATGTGMLRVAHNRHWAGDVMAGAGIGVLSAELAYCISDLIFRDKGIDKEELDDMTDEEHPSFVDVQMGVGINHTTLCFATPDAPTAATLTLGTRMTAGIEAAYFYNRYVGTGGMLRITSTPVSCDNMMDVAVDAGLYLNLPLPKRLSIGAKALAGMRTGGRATVAQGTGSTTATTAKLDASNTVNCVVGVSCTWRYKDNCGWKLFADLDSSRKTFTLAMPTTMTTASATTMTTTPTTTTATSATTATAQQRLRMRQWTVGGAFTVCF